jgi:hypothetical protein
VVAEGALCDRIEASKIPLLPIESYDHVPVHPFFSAHEAPCLCRTEKMMKMREKSSETEVQRSSAIGAFTPTTKLIEVPTGYATSCKQATSKSKKESTLMRR